MMRQIKHVLFLSSTRSPYPRRPSGYSEAVTQAQSAERRNGHTMASSCSLFTTRSVARSPPSCSQTTRPVVVPSQRRHIASPECFFFPGPGLSGIHRPQRRVASHALPPEFKASIDDFVTSNKIVVFMKGNREIPQCGFSNTVVQILNQLSVPYVTVDILENEMLRAGMKEYSMWWVLSLDRRALARTESLARSLTRSLAHSLTRLDRSPGPRFRRSMWTASSTVGIELDRRALVRPAVLTRATRFARSFQAAAIL